MAAIFIPLSPRAPQILSYFLILTKITGFFHQFHTHTLTSFILTKIALFALKSGPEWSARN